MHLPVSLTDCATASLLYVAAKQCFPIRNNVLFHQRFPLPRRRSTLNALSLPNDVNAKRNCETGPNF